MAYRLGAGLHIFRARAPVVCRGGLMVVSGESGGDFQGGDAAGLCREILRECQARHFSGVILDLSPPLAEPLPRAVALLAHQLARGGLACYLPEDCAGYADSAHLMVSSALSGGTLETRLGEAVARFGPGRVVLALERGAEDFFLPAPRGAGRPLSRAELRGRMDELAPAVFFSREFCAHYFTYTDGGNGAHFVLFDDLGSLTRKLALAEGLGIRRFFFSYEQVEDLLPALLRGGATAG
jgi:hypothetical protein